MLGCLCRKKPVEVYSGMPCRKELLSDLKINGHLVLITGVDGVLETLRFSPLFLFLFNPTAPVLGLFDQMWCYEDTILTRRWYFEDDRSLPEELPGVAAAFGFCDKKNVRIYHCVTIYALRDQPWNTCLYVYIFLINILCTGSTKNNGGEKRMMTMMVVMINMIHTHFSERRPERKASVCKAIWRNCVIFSSLSYFYHDRCHYWLRQEL